MRLPSRLLLPVLLLAAALTLPSPSAAQRGTGGLVIAARDHATGRPLLGVEVQVDGIPTVATTDSAGIARIVSIPPGARMVRVRGAGLQAEVFITEIQANQATEAEVNMVRAAAIELDEVTVTGTMPNRALRDVGFYRRRAGGMGEYLTREDILERNPASLSDLFRSVPFVRVQYCDWCQEKGYVLVSNRGPVSIHECAMRVFLDGIPVDFENIDKYHVNEIDGIEVYRNSAAMPAQFNRTGASCGVVVLWTRTY